mmetsp:Transcript_106331/g.300846  ORF Transcript_106331/g.300846 Transcript_106331/m.300846 type:complete len:154 (+) Transcript_106331:62-523(+)
MCCLVSAVQDVADSARDDWALPQTTYFRRWNSTAGLGQEPVPGLRGALMEAGLASFIATAESWCLDMGAAFLDELICEFEHFCKALSHPGPAAPSPEQRQQLHCILVARNECHQEAARGFEHWHATCPARRPDPSACRQHLPPENMSHAPPYC